MRIGVVGAGGVGALLGGLLARAGSEVAFVARGRQLEALRREGLSVDSPRVAFQLPALEAAEDPAALAPCDALLVAVKAWQVKALAPALAPLLRPDGFAVPLQNGVEAADVLASALGEQRVVGGLCHMFAWLEGPGRVKHAGEFLRVTMGERGPRKGAPSARLERLAAALREAQVDVALPPDVDVPLWEKFVFMAAYGAVGAVSRAPAGVLRTVPETRALLLTAMEEVAALGRARGVPLPPDAAARALRLLDGVTPESTASIQRDILAGRPSELFDQGGAVVRLAEAAGLAAPVHGVLFAALLPQELAARRAAGLA